MTNHYIAWMYQLQQCGLDLFQSQHTLAMVQHIGHCTGAIPVMRNNNITTMVVVAVGWYHYHIQVHVPVGLDRCGVRDLIKKYHFTKGHAGHFWWVPHFRGDHQVTIHGKNTSRLGRRVVEIIVFPEKITRGWFRWDFQMLVHHQSGVTSMTHKG